MFQQLTFTRRWISRPISISFTSLSAVSIETVSQIASVVGCWLKCCVGQTLLDHYQDLPGCHSQPLHIQNGNEMSSPITILQHFQPLTFTRRWTSQTNSPLVSQVLSAASSEIVSQIASEVGCWLKCGIGKTLLDHCQDLPGFHNPLLHIQIPIN